MRKNLLASITGPDTPKSDHDTRSAYAARGASRSMMLSIDEMAENSKKMIAGEAIISLDPNLVDSSFVSDRIGDDLQYTELRDAIKKHGQSTPILVRPHPDDEGRYMVVFGHRRARVAKELGIEIRAVVKDIEDIAHVIAQGQENSARADLTFIEKALFAKKLLDIGQAKDTIKAALTVDDTLLSRMLSVADTVPLSIIEAIGAAKTVGRDRWEDLKKLMSRPSSVEHAKEVVQSKEFRSKETAEGFNYLLAQLKTGRKSPHKAGQNKRPSSWASNDRRVEASFRNTGKTFSLALKSKDAGEFGQFISSSLESLYTAFKAAKNHETGE
jgi:ParB family transcriptional regulator, chromosome partitioning protein